MSKIANAAAVCVVLASLLTVSEAGTSARPRYTQAIHQPASSASGAELSASAQARRSGHRVEVVAKRTESSETYAEPNGTFTATLHAEQIRARRADGWVPIDTRLRRGADGSVVPGATVVSLAFSGGGDTTLVRLGSGDKAVALSWPTRLPAPVLSGATATYPDVFPGVDLRLTASSSGFQEVLVVKTRAAAQNPEVARLRFGVRTSGLSMRAGKDGGSLLVSSEGETVFSSPAPQMWDSSSTGTPASAASIRTPSDATAEHRTTGQLEWTRDGITVVPDQALLASRNTVYPVFIDPDWSAPAAGWAKIFSGKPTTSYWYGGDDWEPAGSAFAGMNLAKVGYCGWPGCNGVGTAISFFQFDIRGLHGAQVIGQAGVTSGAEFNTTDVYSPTCNGSGHNYGLDLFPGDFNGAQGATWNSPPWIGWNAMIGGVRWEMHGYSSACPASSMGWGVGDWVRYANDSGATFATFVLAANDQNNPDPYTWKKFRDYSLLVHYDWPPYAPTNLSTSAGTTSLPCSGVQYVNNAAGDITLRATASDPDAGQPMWQQFEWWTRDHATSLGSSNSGPQGNPSVFTALIPRGSLAHGTDLSWRVHTGDGIVAGPLSQWCDVSVDNQPPATSPKLTPVNPPATIQAGQPITFTVDANGVSDVSSFRYGLSRGGGCVTTSSVNASALGGSATFTVTPLSPSQRWDLWVASVDRAGNPSKCLDYVFQVVAGSAPVAHWPLDGSGGTSAPDLLGKHDGTVNGTTTWVNGQVGDGLNLDGQTGYVSTAGGTLVDTSRSFSVSAWAKVDALDSGFHTVVSEDSASISGFFLDYRGDTGKWTFWMPRSDCSSCASDFAAGPAQPGVWTHLVGVYDALSGQISLYVNGVLAQTTGHTTPWKASGSVQIGRGKFNGAPTAYMLGGIDDVQIYDRVLSDQPFAAAGESAPRSEIDRLASPPMELAYYPLDEGQGAVAGDQSGSYRTMTLTGATWTSGRIGNGVHFDGTGQGATNTAILRTDRSFTVMGLFRVDDPTSNRWQIAFSQDGPTAGGFYLQYRPDTHRWNAGVLTPDPANPGWQSVDSTSTAQTTWQHVTVVYDAGGPELRLYVHGALEKSQPVTAPPNTTGAFHIGQGRSNGGNGTCCGFAGSVDEVHVYAGVLSDQQIRDANAQYTPRDAGLYSTAFERFVSHDGHHYVGTGPVPPWYHFEGPMGVPAPAGAPNTQMIYSCRYSGGFFLDASPTCAGNGHEVLGPAGLMYTQQPTDVPTIAVYRCVVLSSGDHFVARDPNCESTPDKIRNEGQLGYVRQLAPLLRFSLPDGGEWTSYGGSQLPPGAAPAAGLGFVSLVSATGTVALYACRSDADQFLSTSAGCDGGTNLTKAGEIWSQPPAGVADSEPLYACRSSGGDRFESLDQFCEGGEQTSPLPLGYVATQL